MIEKYRTKLSGYHPFLIRDGWQVAQLNYIKEQNIENICRLDIHHETDEVFVLLGGEVVLITAQLEENEVYFKTELMVSNVVYNIPRNVWHNIAMKEGSEVLIIENSNTHLDDFEYYYLNETQINQLKEKVVKVLEE
jgi:mannose-6-phosphate isomerase-like protein (cupin superfamily)